MTNRSSQYGGVHCLFSCAKWKDCNLRENGSDTNSIFWCISSMAFMIIVSARYMVHNIGHTVIEFVTMQQKRVAQ